MRHDFALKNIQARRICLSCSHDRHGLALSCWTCSYMSALLLKHCLILKFPLKRFLCQRAACTASQILLYLQGAFCAQQALVHEFFLLHYTTACHGALLPSPRTHQLADQGGNIIHKRLILRRGPHFPGTMQARRRCKSCSQSGPYSCARPSKPAAPSTWPHAVPAWPLRTRTPPLPRLSTFESSGRAIQGIPWAFSTNGWKVDKREWVAPRAKASIHCPLRLSWSDSASVD